MSRHVVEEAKRCLQCKDPLCQKGCPVNTPIKNSIKLLLESKIFEAGEGLFANNPLSLVCSFVCPQENQCEGHCVLSKKGMPVQISVIEQYISSFYLNAVKPEKAVAKKAKVAVIGSGPAGITISFILAKKGYDITIFEGNDRIGGVLRYGIPEFRLPKQVIDSLKEIMLEYGVKIRPNTSIGANLTIDDLERDGFKAIFMGTGVWRPSKMNVKGESFGNVHYAIEYLRNPNVYALGEKLIVIGGGNVAMDVARTAFRHGAREVNIFCNGNREGMTARNIEIEYAKIDGAKIHFYKEAVEFTEKGAWFADAEGAEAGGAAQDDIMVAERVSKNGAIQRFVEANSVIIATGQGPRAVIVSTAKDIQVNDKGLVAVDEFGHTTRKGIFASGDVVTGAKTVVEAVKVSKRVAAAIEEYLIGLEK